MAVRLCLGQQIAEAMAARYRGFSLMRKRAHPLGQPYGLGHRPTVGSWGGMGVLISEVPLEGGHYERGIFMSEKPLRGGGVFLCARYPRQAWAGQLSVAVRLCLGQQIAEAMAAIH